MRGIAVLSAAAASWVLVTGILPDVRVRFGVRTDTRTLAAAAGIFLIVFAAANSILGVPMVAASVAAIAAVVPIAAERRRAQREASRVREAWPDILAHVRSGISAGATLDDAFLAALERSEEAPTELADVVRREIVFGGGLADALAEIAEQQDDPTTDRVAATLRSASGTGGPRVGEIVGVLGRSVAEELRLRKAHDAALTEHRWTVNVALVAPWALLSLSVATNPQAASAFSGPAGALIIVAGFAATAIGWVLARRTARLSEPPRVFR